MSRGNLFLRVEHGEWDFLASLDHDAAVPFDAAIVSDRYLAPYPKTHRRHGEAPDRLIDELEDLHVPWLLDPDTARLGHHLIEQRSRPRAANSPIAKAVPLPLSPGLGLPSGEAEALVDATAGVQLRSTMFAAPYLEVSGVGDPRFETNLRLLELSRERAGDRTLVAYLQTMSRYMHDGSAAAAGIALAAAGADVILVRIRRFSPETASAENLFAYSQLVAAIESTDAITVTDAVGRLGPVLVACGADGFSSGAFHFRSVPDDLCPTGGGGNLVPLSWEIPGRFESVPRGQSARTTAGWVRCNFPKCPAPTGAESEVAVRTHNLHELKSQARLAAAEGLAYSARLRAAGSRYPAEWATVLERLQQLAA
jgi:hypothetical protein